MNYSLEGIFSWPQRARHALGYGIHSPYAFSLITGVLGDTISGYYAYDALPAIAGRFGRTEREARSLYRLLLHLRGVAGVGEGAENGMPGAAAITCSSLSATGSFLSEIAGLALPAVPSSLLFSDCFSGSPEDAAAVIRRHLEDAPSAVLLSGINRSADARVLRRLLLADRPAGMAFDGWHTLLIVSRRGLPSQTFRVLFPR